MFKRFISHRFLLEELVKRDFIHKYKRTALGIVWSVLSPLLMLLVMWMMFTHFFGRDTPHYSLYLFAGVIMLNYFSEATSGGMAALVGNAKIFSKVNVPKYMFILSRNIASTFNFLLTFIVFFIFVLFDDYTLFTWKFFLLPYPIFCITLLNIGVGLILSALFVFIKDIQYLYQVFLRVLMYTSATFYRIDTFNETAQRIFKLNAVYLASKYIRDIVIDGLTPSLMEHGLLAGYAIVIFAIGCFVYIKANRHFLYYI